MRGRRRELLGDSIPGGRLAPRRDRSGGIYKLNQVAGGGMTGMTAAKSAAAAGYKVTLVEKEAKLGTTSPVGKHLDR